MPQAHAKCEPAAHSLGIGVERELQVLSGVLKQKMLLGEQVLAAEPPAALHFAFITTAPPRKIDISPMLWHKLAIERHCLELNTHLHG